MDSRFDYHSDFRWNMQLVQQISKKVAKNRGSDSDFKKLSQILDKALESKSGIIAYGD